MRRGDYTTVFGTVSHNLGMGEWPTFTFTFRSKFEVQSSKICNNTAVSNIVLQYAVRHQAWKVESISIHMDTPLLSCACGEIHSE